MDLLMDFAANIAAILNIKASQVGNTIDLLEQDNTTPFIARYRKEATGNLDEVQIRDISEHLERLVALEKRKETVIHSINAQGLLTDSLHQQLCQAKTLTDLEDLYLPYRPKRRTRAMIAREKGLEPLATLILAQLITQDPLEILVAPFLSDEVQDCAAAITGAIDIVAEIISETAAIRQAVRENSINHGKLLSEQKVDADDPRRTYQTYYQFDVQIRHAKPHHILALNRGEKEGILRVTIQFFEGDWLNPIHTEYSPNTESIFFDALNNAINDSAKRLLLPAIERDIRRMLTKQAEEHAISVFANNLKALLTQPPLAGFVILAIDPGFRTGSKIVVVDPFGKLLDTKTIYPHPPQSQREKYLNIIEELIQKYQVNLIVIGNGTASRETEQLIAEVTRNNKSVAYLITSEAGASVYSASDQARLEFPDLDVSMRGAVSIARRVQDPLAELVKIDPKSIGVGMYQHDVDQIRLNEALDQVVESVVNTVGVDLNTASAPLLTYVAGIGKNIAQNIVQYRDEFGPFGEREALQDVPGLGPKTFVQAAGFLRIRDGDFPLDATAIHPESYPTALRLYEMMGISLVADTDERTRKINRYFEHTNLQSLSKELQVGEHTLQDILAEIARPGRDPRDDLPKQILRQDVLSIEDLIPGMEITGTIRNVVDFGAFVDIGVKFDGLLHSSKIEKNLVLKVGDIIQLIVASIDIERQRISLEMKERKQS